jgi:hypothetical protein
MSARGRFVTVAGLGAVALGAAVLLWLVPSLLGLAGGAAPEVATVLGSAARPPVQLAVKGSAVPLVGRALHFERVTVAEEGREGARAVSTLDFEGTYGDVRVSSLGRETTRFRRTGAGWELEGSLAPTLCAALAALVARRAALERGDAAVLAGLLVDADRQKALADPALRTWLARSQRNVPIQAWYLRSETGEITVTEEEGQPPTLHRLRLVPKGTAAPEFVFAGSLL